MHPPQAPGMDEGQGLDIPDHWTSCQITPALGGLFETFLIRLKGKGVDFVTTEQSTTLRIEYTERGAYEEANIF